MQIALVQQRATADKQANVERGLEALQAAAANGAQARLLRGAGVRAVLPAAPGGPGLREPRRAGPGPDHRGVPGEGRGARRRRRAQPVRARRRPHVRQLAGHRRRRPPARLHADDPHHRVPVLPRAGLLHAGRHRRAGLRHDGRPARRGHLLRPPLPRVHARAGVGRRRAGGRAAGRLGRRVARGALRSGDAGGRVPERLLHGAVQPRGRGGVPDVRRRVVRLRAERHGDREGAGRARRRFSTPTSTSTRSSGRTRAGCSSSTGGRSCTDGGSRHRTFELGDLGNVAICDGRAPYGQLARSPAREPPVARSPATAATTSAPARRSSGR